MANATPVQQLVLGVRRARDLAKRVRSSDSERLLALIDTAAATNRTLRQTIGDPTVAPAPSPTRTAAAMARLAAARTRTATEVTT